MKKHRTVLGLVAVLAGLVLLVGGVATASNMGFKFVPQIPGTAGANAYNLALPWNNNYTNAQSLVSDLGVAKVAQFNGNSTLTSWTSTGAGTNFAITKGQAYIAYGQGSGQTPVVVGSHDPNFTFTFTGGQAYNAAAPYHQTLTNAQGLIASINGTCPSSISKVAQFNSNSTLTSWTSSGAGTNFALSLGSGVIVSAASTCSGYVWPHY